MDEKKLKKILEEHFHTKKEYALLSKGVVSLSRNFGDFKKEQNLLREDFEEFRDFVSKNVVTKKDLKKELESFITKTEFLDFKLEMHEFMREMREFRRETREEFKVIGEKLNEIKPLAKSLDLILEKYPVERIARLEKHSKLSPFAPAVSTEE